MPLSPQRPRPSLEVLEERRLLTAYVVTSATDDGKGDVAGTLSYGITQANAGKVSVIDFHIGTLGTAQTITLTSALPALTASHVSINGLSQNTNGNSLRLITLDGSDTGPASDGLHLKGADNSVTGLIIEGFNNGIQVSGTANSIGGSATGAGNVISGNDNDGVLIDNGISGTLVQGNLIGTTSSGTAALGNGLTGIDDSGTSTNIHGNYIAGNTTGVELHTASTSAVVQANRIGTNTAGSAALPNSVGIIVFGSKALLGGTTTGLGNLVSGNGIGMELYSATSSYQVEGNFIGTNAAGTAAVGNSTAGVEMLGTHLTLGGTATGAGNVISGNTVGVKVTNTANLIEGNRIGTNAAGTGSVGNRAGIEILGAQATIGGTVAGAGNLISGNRTGVELNYSGTLVEGNHIGTNAAGTAALTGQSTGIEIFGSNNSIGATAGGAGNIISGNSYTGVLVASGSGNNLHHNSIFGNGAAGHGPGIVLTSGANNNVAAPALSSAVLSGSTLTVKGTFKATTTGKAYVVEIFASPAGDPEGKVYLGSLTVTPTATGTQSFIFTTTTTATGSDPLITATLTDSSNDTSAFSGGVTVT